MWHSGTAENGSLTDLRSCSMLQQRKKMSVELTVPVKYFNQTVRKNMWKVSGKSICEGIAYGPVSVLKKNRQQVQKAEVQDTEAEILRLKAAVRETNQQLEMLHKKVLEESGEDSAAVLEAYGMLLMDPVYQETVCNRIHNGRLNAESAVVELTESFAERFSSMEDAYMKERAVDLKDVSEWLVRNLLGEKSMDPSGPEPSILLAEDLSPSQMLQLNRGKILGLILVHGSPYSHTAILAGKMNIPAVTEVPVNPEEIRTGVMAAVDAYTGEVVFDPTAEVQMQIEQRIKEAQKSADILRSLKGRESITSDGRKIRLLANIDSIEEIESVLEHDAEGIGLFRSEYLCLEKGRFPSEEEQFAVYRQLLNKMGRKEVTIRTLDLGADKQSEEPKLQRELQPQKEVYLQKEMNPAMGYRGIRICLKEQEIFKMQLRALLRAAVFGNLSILYPMITSTEEVEQIYGIVEETAQELELQKIPYRIPRQGIMIETPAAALISGELAELVDFFSIGTNDLIQFTLAADRMNEQVHTYYDPLHKAVWKLMQMTVDHAHRAGIRVEVCGELASDPKMTGMLVDMGVDALSMTPSRILRIRKKIHEI